MKQRELLLFRGLPGAGKSTEAQRCKKDMGAFVFATDDLLEEDGKYLWTPERSAHFHKVNQRRAAHAMRGGLTPIIIDNPNLQPFVAAPYVRLALYYGYEWKVVEIKTPSARNPEELARRNKHGVTLEQIREGLDLMNKWPLEKYIDALKFEPAQDPEALIAQAEAALAEHDYPLVEDIIWSYEDWRKQGGYMPEPDGDKRIGMIELQVKPWLDNIYDERANKTFSYER